jgi:hypothetical protein
MSDACGNTGRFVRTWTATDECGNTASSTQTITIVDTTPPTIACAAAIPPTTCAALPTFTPPTVSDACDPHPTVTYADSTVTACAGSYTMSRTWTATDACGNTASCTQTIAVADTTPPVFVCPANIVASCNTNAFAPVSYTLPTASDDCSTAGVVCTPPSGSSFPLGTTPVTCTATDSCGNAQTCTFTVKRAGFQFVGFLPPIGGEVATGTGGTYTDPLRSFKLKSTIPVKFLLTCGGQPMTTGAHTLQAIKYSSTTTADSAIDATPTDAATSGNEFRLTDAASGEWHFNLSTKTGFSKGIWKLVATLSDGSTHEVWIEIKP